MSALRSAVYIAPPIPFQNPAKPGKSAGVWSPISCTLIYTATSAALVDTPITVQQTEELIAWIERTAPGRALTHIYITHGHGDHFFGIPVLLRRWPDAAALATAATVRRMRQQVEPRAFEQAWEARFPGGQIARPFALAEPLDAARNEFALDGRWTLRAVEVGHADTPDSTALWVPDLRLAVCGDVVYGQVHQMLGEANTAAKRAEWIAAVEKVEALGPALVVPGHQLPGEVHGVWHLENTKQYIRDFGRVVEGGAKSPREVVEAMTKLYPDRFNTAALIMGAMAAFSVPREKKM